MLTHGHMPSDLMKTAIVHILKNRQGDTSDKNNYRPIAIVTAMSKILELCIMKLIETHLVTSDNQFGFKRQHGTDLCIFTVKSVIKYYNIITSLKSYAISLRKIMKFIITTLEQKICFAFHMNLKLSPLLVQNFGMHLV